MNHSAYRVGGDAYFTLRRIMLPDAVSQWARGASEKVLSPYGGGKMQCAFRRRAEQSLRSAESAEAPLQGFARRFVAEPRRRAILIDTGKQNCRENRIFPAPLTKALWQSPPVGINFTQTVAHEFTAAVAQSLYHQGGFAGKTTMSRLFFPWR